MKRTLCASIICLLALSASIGAFSLGAFSEPSFSVHNIDTELDYATIQAAIDAPETQDGHRIFVDTGTYYENLHIEKTVSLLGEDKSSTIIDGGGAKNVIYVNGVSGVTVSGFTIRNSGIHEMSDGGADSGIFVYGSDSNVSYNIIRDNYYGIYLWWGSNNVFSGNEIINNTNGIGIPNLSGINFITGNTVSSSSNYGVVLNGTYNSIVVNNTISKNEYGIYSYQSVSNAFARNSVFLNLKHGIYLADSHSNEVSKNIVSSNNEYGIYLYYSTNNNLSDNIVPGNNSDEICLEHSSVNALAKNSMNSTNLSFSHNNLLSYNNVTGRGISISESNNNIIIGNNIQQSTEAAGIRVHRGGYNTISCNNISNNSGHGIQLVDTSNNVVNANCLMNNDFFGVSIEGGSRNTLLGNNISRNQNGVKLASRYSILRGNDVFSNIYAGIDLAGSAGNVLIANAFRANNEYGILVRSGYDFSSNSLFHNNFIDNTHQAFLESASLLDKWDNGAEGNHWNDYLGEDSDENGIGDTPKSVNQTNGVRDNYPLMEPWSQNRLFNVAWDGGTYKVGTLSDSTIANLSFDPVDRQISFKTTGPNGTIGFCNVTVPKKLLEAELDQWVVTFGNQTITPVITENSTHTFIYLKFQHSTHTVSLKAMAHLLVWPQWWFWAIIALTSITVVLLPLSVRYYLSFKRQREILKEYGRRIVTLPISHAERASYQFIRNVIESAEKTEKFGEKYGVKIRSAKTLDEAKKRMGIQEKS